MFATIQKFAKTLTYFGSKREAVTDGVQTTTVTIAPNGAIWLEQSGQIPGNARGAGAFDCQSARTSAAQVASGANSTALGVSNTPSGANAFVSGNSNTVSSTNGAAFGSLSSVSGNNAFTAGVYHQASGSSVACFGDRATNGITASLAIGGGVGYGQHQAGVIPLGKTTADATPTILDITNLSTARPTIPAKVAWHFRAQCIAYGPTYKASAWSIEGVICRDGSNNTRIVGTPSITLIAQDTEMAGCAVAVSADDTNEALAVTVTGLAATSIRWTCSVFYSQTIQA